MKVIYKYTLELVDFQFVDMPKNAKILSAQVQHGQPRLWAVCDPELPMQGRRVFMIRTGNPLFNGLAPGVVYIDTIQDGILVWHVFAENDWPYIDSENR